MFDGFSTDNLIQLPPELFTEIVPAIRDAAELKVTLHVFYALSRRRGRNKRVGWDELLEDELLRRSLRAIARQRPLAQVLEQALNSAVTRGTLLHVVSMEQGRAKSWYLANTAANRAWAARQEAQLEPSPAAQDQPPEVYTLYEQNIGMLTPILAEELREAAERFPEAWVAEAIREAVRSNVRNWRYIRKILERWEADGKSTPQDRDERSFDLSKYTTGKYASLFRRDDDVDVSDV